MNILVVFFHFPPISGGGVVVAVDIVNALAKLGHKVTVLTPKLNWEGPKYEPKIHSNVETIYVDVPSNNNPKVAARRCKKPLIDYGNKVCKEEKFDFIFSIFHPFHFAPNAAVSIGKKQNIPVVVKVDDAVYSKSTGLKLIQRRIEKIISSKVLKNASKILVSNEETKKIINNYYNVKNENISILPNGIDSNYFKKHKNNSTNIVIFSGVMYGHRGLETLINSIPKIIKSVSDVKFLLLGEGPDLNKLKEIANRNKIQEYVEFKGWIDRSKIPEYLSEASIGIGPLKSTTVTKNALPIKILEYMASELPILALKNTLPSDVIVDGENGFLVDDENQLSEKIIYLLKNQDKMREMGLRSKELVKNFDWENLSKKIIFEYESIKS